MSNDSVTVLFSEKDKKPKAKEILNVKINFSKSTFDLYKWFKIDTGDNIQFDAYFLDYFVRLLKRLKDINFEDVQKQRNLVI